MNFPKSVKNDSLFSSGNAFCKGFLKEKRFFAVIKEKFL